MKFLKFVKNNNIKISNFINLKKTGVKEIVDALSRVIDPETGIDIVSLGLIYGITLDKEDILVKMSMTTPACPMSGYLADLAKENIQLLAGINSVKIQIVWEPAWSINMMSDKAKEQLGWQK